MAIKTSSENFRNFCDRFWKALVELYMMVHVYSVRSVDQFQENLF
eukprot:SAG11_NODE_85_length_17370_cov_29.272017_7_plen_45_part_00